MAAVTSGWTPRAVSISTCLRRISWDALLTTVFWDCLSDLKHVEDKGSKLGLGEAGELLPALVPRGRVVGVDRQERHRHRVLTSHLRLT